MPPNAKGEQRRAVWRRRCAPALRSPASHLRMSYRFFVGVPISEPDDPFSHDQGLNATAADAVAHESASKRTMAETEERNPAKP